MYLGIDNYRPKILLDRNEVVAFIFGNANSFIGKALRNIWISDEQCLGDEEVTPCWPRWPVIFDFDGTHFEIKTSCDKVLALSVNSINITKNFDFYGVIVNWTRCTDNTLLKYINKIITGIEIYDQIKEEYPSDLFNFREFDKDSNRPDRYLCGIGLLFGNELLVAEIGIDEFCFSADKGCFENEIRTTRILKSEVANSLYLSSPYEHLWPLEALNTPEEIFARFSGFLRNSIDKEIEAIYVQQYVRKDEINFLYGPVIVRMGGNNIAVQTNAGGFCLSVNKYDLFDYPFSYYGNEEDCNALDTFITDDDDLVYWKDVLKDKYNSLKGHQLKNIIITKSEKFDLAWEFAFCFDDGGDFSIDPFGITHEVRFTSEKTKYYLIVPI